MHSSSLAFLGCGDAYHEGSFGIYRNDSGPPDPTQANQPLIALFRRKLP